MKRMISRWLLAVAISLPVTLFVYNAFAQEPTIENRRDFKFGAWAANPNAQGTVVISPNADTATSTGGLISFGGNIKRARFRIEGDAKAYVFILLPSSFTIRKGATNNFMTVSNITMDRANPIRLSNNGVRTINLGATVTVGAGQTKGNYNDENEFTISAFYN
jgi:hypothetical protein